MAAVVLSWGELRVAALVGIDRNLRGMANGRRRRYGQAYGWDDTIIGLIGEIAIAKLLDRYPSLGPEPDVGDVGPYQVRATDRVDGCLIVHEHESGDTRFVLVRGCPPVLDVAGWIVGADAKRAEWWRTEGVRHPAYFVPAAALHPIETLV